MKGSFSTKSIQQRSGQFLPWAWFLLQSSLRLELVELNRSELGISDVSLPGGTTPRRPNTAVFESKGFDVETSFSSFLHVPPHRRPSSSFVVPGGHLDAKDY